MGKSTQSSVEPEQEQDPEDEQDQGPKVTPVFEHGPAVPFRRVPTRRNLYGRDVDEIEAEDPEAATQWDVRLWRPL